MVDAIMAPTDVNAPKRDLRKDNMPAANAGDFSVALAGSSLPGSTLPFFSAAKAKTLSSAGQASPTQMFEPWTANPSERQTAQFKSELEDNQRTSAYQDRIDEEFTESSSPGSHDAHPAMNTQSSSKPVAIEREPAANGPALRGKRESIIQKQVSGTAVPNRIAGTANEPRGLESPLRSIPGSNIGNTQADGVTSSIAQGASANPAVSTPVTGASARSDVAEQVARALAAPRSNSAEAVRGPTSGQPVGEGRPAPPNTSGSDRPGPSDRAAASREASPQDRMDNAERSEFDKLVRSIRMQVGERQSSAKMHLDPPKLGRMFVDVRVKEGTMQINIRTETEEAKSLLNERAGQLRTALATAGVQIDRFEVRANFAAAQSPAGAGGPFWGGGADQSKRSFSDARQDRLDEGGSAEAGGWPRIDGVGSVEMGRDEMVLQGWERRLDLHI